MLHPRQLPVDGRKAELAVAFWRLGDGLTPAELMQVLAQLQAEVANLQARWDRHGRYDIKSGEHSGIVRRTWVVRTVTR